MATPVVGARGLSSCGGRTLEHADSCSRACGLSSCGGRTLEHGDSCSRGTRASVVVEGGP